MRNHISKFPAIFLLIGSVFLNSYAEASNQAEKPRTLYYEPCSVNLTGKVLFVRLAHNVNEDYYVLLMEEPINVQGKRNSQTDMDSYSNIKKVQISSNPIKWPIRPYIGKTVRIYGSLFEANTVHHHTKVLIWVKKIQILNRTKSSQE